MSRNTQSRRDFLKFSSVFASGILFIPQTKIFGQHLSDFANWMQILDYAICAPSPHNMQHWRVELVNNQKAKLLYDPTRLLPAGDPEFKFMTLAMGIFLEYMDIAAKSIGYSVIHDQKFKIINNNSPELSYFCSLELVPNKAKSDFDPALIKSRKTSRLQYYGEPVSETTMNLLTQEAKGFGHKLDYADQDELVDWFMELNKNALFHDLEDDAVRTEIDRLFRYSKKEANEKPYGLSAKCMGFSGKLLKSVFRKPQLWLNSSGSKILGKRYQQKFKGTKTIAWIQGRWDTTTELVQSGKLFGRIWLHLEREGYVLQPLGSLITNPVAHQEIASKLQIDESEAKLWLMIRIGKSDKPPRSKRIKLQELVIGKAAQPSF